MNEKPESNQPVNPPAQQPKRPNETGTLQVDGFVKIFDPNSKEVFVEKRA